MLKATSHPQICVIVDDMADTCGTLVKAADTLLENGAKEVHAYVIHGIFSGPALERINNSKSLTSVVATNTLPQDKNLAGCRKLKVCVPCCCPYLSKSAAF